MKTLARLVCVFAALSACGCGGSPAAPAAPTPVTCVPQTMQCLLDAAIVTVIVNDVGVNTGSMATVTGGSKYALSVNYANSNPGQAVWAAFWFVRDDGLQRIPNCFGGGGGPTGGTGGFSAGATISTTDAMFAPGHTIRVIVVGTFGAPPAPVPESQCPFRLSNGQLNDAAVQGQRHVVTFAVQ